MRLSAVGRPTMRRPAPLALAGGPHFPNHASHAWGPGPRCLQDGRLIVSAPGELPLGANFCVFSSWVPHPSLTRGHARFVLVARS